MSRFTRTTAIVSLFTVILASGCEHSAYLESSRPVEDNWSIMLPVSLNEVMVALVNDAADPIWHADWEPPANEAGWRALERHAYQLEIAGTLLTVPGTGPLDRYWVSNPQWIYYAERLSATGAKAREALAQRDNAAIRAVGNELVEVCEGCHIALKPDEPTGGKYGELPPHSDDRE